MFYIAWVVGVLAAIGLAAAITIKADKAGKLD